MAYGRKEFLVQFTKMGLRRAQGRVTKKGYIARAEAELLDLKAKECHRSFDRGYVRHRNHLASVRSEDDCPKFPAYPEEFHQDRIGRQGLAHLRESQGRRPLKFRESRVGIGHLPNELQQLSLTHPGELLELAVAHE